jgi:hypothetical protein
LYSGLASFSAINRAYFSRRIFLCVEGIWIRSVYYRAVIQLLDTGQELAISIVTGLIQDGWWHWKVRHGRKTSFWIGTFRNAVCFFMFMLQVNAMKDA